jgi:ribose/xylose/arabinose/galactoside ABC-type transport system permease subunit
VWVLVIAVGLWALLQHTALGRHVYGAGSNAEGMRAAGLSPRRAQLMAFVVAGALVAAGAVLLAGSTATGDPKSGDPYLLNAIAAVALTGARFTGGRGSIAGTLAAAAVLGLIGNLLLLAGIESYWQYVIGSITIVAVIGLPVVWRAVVTWAGSHDDRPRGTPHQPFPAGRPGRRASSAWPLLVFALLFAVGAVLRPSLLSMGALWSTVAFAMILALASFGQTLAVVQGGIDLSVPSTIALSALTFLSTADSLGSLGAFLAPSARVGWRNGGLRGDRTDIL